MQKLHRIAGINRLWAPYLVLLFSFFLLTWQWDAHGLWDDELFTIRLAQAPALADIIAGAQADIHPPLHFVLMRGWIALTGPTDYAIRFSSVASAIIAIALTYRIGRRLFGGFVARWSMLLLSISPFLVLYARMARYYTFAMMLGMLSLYLFVRLSQDTERRYVSWVNLVGWIVVAPLLLYTDYPTSVVLVGENLLMLFYFRRFRHLWPKWLAAQVMAAIGFLPWARVVLSQVKDASTRFNVEFPRGLFGTLFKLGHPLYSFAVGETIMPWQPAAILGLLAAVVLTVAGLRAAASKRAWNYIFVAVFLLLPLFYLISVSFLVVYAFPSRAMVALPFLYMLMAIGLRQMPRKSGQIALGGLIVAFAFGLANYYLGYQFINPTYAVPTPAILRTINAQVQSGDIIASESASGFDYYYALSEDSLPNFVNFDEARAFIATNRSPRVWLLLIGRDSTRQQTPTDFVDWLQQGYELNQTWGFGPVDPLYQRLKSRVLAREVYAYKATLYLYVRREGM